MKKRVLVLAGLALVTGMGSISLANVGLMDWIFRAPSLSDVDAIDPKTRGDIVYDTTNDLFKGWNGASWVTFGSANPPSSNVTTVSTNTSLLSSNDIVLADADAGGITLTLPSAVGLPGKILTIKKVDDKYNVVTIDGDSSETIDGAAAKTLGKQNETLMLFSNGTNWQVISSLKGSMDGTTQARAGVSCLQIKKDGYSTGDGTYWINPQEGSTTNAFQAYCDMTTDGGGWTRVAGINGANANHLDFLAVSAGSLTTSSADGKFSDFIINALAKSQYRLTCVSTTGYFLAKCEFKAVEDATGLCTDMATSYGGEGTGQYHQSLSRGLAAGNNGFSHRLIWGYSGQNGCNYGSGWGNAGSLWVK